MGAPPPSSQTTPLPDDLPFRIISRTIGLGAYAFIRKACPTDQPKPVIAVKFINKAHAFRQGRLQPKQLQKELALHKFLGKHQNIIHFLASGEDVSWTWIAMELADGGDLFDKIEADVGVGMDIAHFYFTQLISAVSYMHSKGVAHRDIKPENILLSGEGNLKLADFGLAALFRKVGESQVRLCNTVCGSPPYIAPEIVSGKRHKRQDILASGYAPDICDIWSCGVVLFVLLVGNTPWDEPTQQSYEFNQYVASNGRMGDDLWKKIPSEILSLLRGMLKLNPKERFTLDEVRTHPWFTRHNPHLSSSGTAANPISLATQMLENLRIDFNAQPTLSQRDSQNDAMDLDIPRFAATQPETPLDNNPFDWEKPPRIAAAGVSASQPMHHTRISHGLLDQIADDPSLSQFTPTPSVPLSLTQMAKRFRDIVPAYSLARFLSPLSLSLLAPLLVEALHNLGVASRVQEAAEGQVWIKIDTHDTRQQALKGTITAERISEELVEVRFVKAKGDPLQWRRFFKKVVVLCKDGILVPG
ncbi:Pkinase-domain-containing protein [Patellaria atrata CBS 101060]|uniref:non-specific serine/threonine protein kinase n=1 Tax=Patellaria atrata CBS 101060 TaxID=1346257 RepID=A0A9P4VSN7_9PEZI|nr:Pkinase-domain-containing protein [Patellaria atrata CBS 101060]